MITYGRIYFAVGAAPEHYITVQHCPDMSGLLQFADVLSGLTVARITRCELIFVTWCDHTESAGDYANLDLKGIIKFRDIDGDRRLWAIPLPAPRVDLFEEHDGKLQLKDDIGETVTSAYATMSGERFEYAHGWLVGNSY
jgi:hypothetical protein